MPGQVELAAAASVGQGAGQAGVPSPAARLTDAVAHGTLAWRLSEPEEVAAVIGPPRDATTRRDGGMEVRMLRYSDTFMVAFGREFGSGKPFLLIGAEEAGRRIGPAPGERVVLRTRADLAKLPPFTGLQSVDASRVDLREDEALLRTLPFNTRTVWPPADRLPAGFDPHALIRDGRNPGLGIRALHARGIDGRGVTIGIIDQPLVPDHAEVDGRLSVIAELDVAGVPPQMHGPAVSSLAAGRTLGVAPGASVAYVSMAMWKSSAGNQLYIDALERLLAIGRDGPSRVRVVSVSSGTFAQAPLADEWSQLLDRAEAEGVIVITCDLARTGLDYGMLAPVPGGDRERPDGYRKGRFGRGLLVPGDGRTYADATGPEEYVYRPQGGMSWAAPYLAGLTALGFQVNPTLTPAQIRSYLAQSATKMPFGDVVNPAGFLDLCRGAQSGRLLSASIRR